MVHELDDGTFVISSHNMWLPGNYADAKAARFAFRLSDQELASMRDDVCVRQRRTITTGDIRKIIASRAR